MVIESLRYLQRSEVTAVDSSSILVLYFEVEVDNARVFEVLLVSVGLKPALTRKVPAMNVKNKRR